MNARRSFKQAEPDHLSLENQMPEARKSEARSLDDEDAGWIVPEPRSAAEQRADAASYIAMMAAELAAMAQGARLDTLNYLLTMAKMEAEVEVERISSRGRLRHFHD